MAVGWWLVRNEARGCKGHWKVSPFHLVVSQNKGPQYRPQNTIVLIIGTPKKGTPSFGKPPLSYTPASLVFRGLRGARILLGFRFRV